MRPVPDLKLLIVISLCVKFIHVWNKVPALVWQRHVPYETPALNCMRSCCRPNFVLALDRMLARERAVIEMRRTWWLSPSCFYFGNTGSGIWAHPACYVFTNYLL